LRSCIDAWETLRPPSQYSNIPPSLPITQISSAPVKRKPPPESLEPFAAAPPPKRRQSGEGSIIGAQRVIQPKPSSNGQSPISFSSPQSGQQPKKRGRPSKADVEARNAELVARGEVLPPPKAATPRPRAPELAPREPESIMQQPRDILNPMRTPIAPMMSPQMGMGMGMGPSSEPSPQMPYESRPIQGRPVDSDASDQSARKKRRPGSRSSQKPSPPGEGSFSAFPGPSPSGFSQFDARTPVAQPPTQLLRSEFPDPLLTPRSDDTGESITVHAQHTKHGQPTPQYDPARENEFRPPAPAPPSSST
jgi:hypothetical protein